MELMCSLERLMGNEVFSDAVSEVLLRLNCQGGCIGHMIPNANIKLDPKGDGPRIRGVSASVAHTPSEDRNLAKRFDGAWSMCIPCPFRPCFHCTQVAFCHDLGGPHTH